MTMRTTLRSTLCASVTIAAAAGPTQAQCSQGASPVEPATAAEWVAAALDAAGIARVTGIGATGVVGASGRAAPTAGVGGAGVTADRAVHTADDAGRPLTPLGPITTRSTDAATLFDRGMRLHFAGMRTEAVAAFEAAVRSDATCAMCFWGIALAYGPELERTRDSLRIGAARRAARQALQAVIARGADWERELVSALYARYSLAPTGGGPAARDSAFASRMVQLGRRWDSADILVLAAEARLSLDAPGNWRAVHGRWKDGAADAIALLESVLAARPAHPAALRMLRTVTGEPRWAAAAEWRDER